MLSFGRLVFFSFDVIGGGAAEILQPFTGMLDFADGAGVVEEEDVVMRGVAVVAFSDGVGEVTDDDVGSAVVSRALGGVGVDVTVGGAAARVRGCRDE